ncbi:MAG: hypothetical protein M3Q29_19450 [Chloroflexota bacterium]|nr:hypothetical protein [Chloroflexota bacterium]
MKPLAAVLIALLLVPFVLVTLLLSLVGAALPTLDRDQPQLPVPAGSVSIHDLGFGPSDAARVDRMIRSIRPQSPLVGQGEHLVRLGAMWRVDPLLIALWAYESEMATTGINSPANGGNMTWAAALEATQQYGCTPGPTSLGHRWARCPSVSAGLALWTDYVGTYYPARGRAEFFTFANTYNPCTDPGNIEHGFLCGTKYADAILELISEHVGYAPGAGPINAGGEWYRYQGEPASFDIAGNQTSNCGPATVAMGIQWKTRVRLNIRSIRNYIGHDGYTTADDLSESLAQWGVSSRRSIGSTADIPAALGRGSIVIVGVRMDAIKRGSDVDGASASPNLRLGRYVSTNVYHWIVVKGVAPGGRNFIVHDPNVWGAPGSARYWYSDGSAKGRDRQYAIADVQAGMSLFSSYPASRALELTK